MSTNWLIIFTTKTKRVGPKYSGTWTPTGGSEAAVAGWGWSCFHQRVLSNSHIHPKTNWRRGTKKLLLENLPETRTHFKRISKMAELKRRRSFWHHQREEKGSCYRATIWSRPLVRGRDCRMDVSTASSHASAETESKKVKHGFPLQRLQSQLHSPELQVKTARVRWGSR